MGSAASRPSASACSASRLCLAPRAKASRRSVCAAVALVVSAPAPEAALRGGGASRRSMAATGTRLRRLSPREPMSGTEARCATSAAGEILKFKFDSAPRDLTIAFQTQKSSL